LSEMKIIMENWSGYLEEAFDACPVQPIDIDSFLDGVEIATMDPDVQKEKIEQLKKQGKNVKNLNNIMEVVGLVGGIPAVAASGGASLGAAVVGIFANVINNVQQKKTDEKTETLLRVLCIDKALLDTISNDIEKTYWANSGIQQEVEAYIRGARGTAAPDPMPDFTEHLVNWLNNDSQSPYAATGTPGLDTDIIVRTG
jgi:hypothetical protein